LSGSVPSVDLTPAAQSAFAVTLFDELARGGMTDVVICPGSRSTPLVLAVAASRLRMHVRLDERSAGFFAIGRALVTDTPVGIVVTSGTAAAELTAAVVEADLAGVALVVITADRPPELRGIGAPQTIDQVKLYGSSVRRYEDPGTIRPGSEPSWRPMASRLLDAATDRRGPVHLNVPLVEPLDATASSVPHGRPDGRPWRSHHRVGGASGSPDLLEEGPVLLVAGRGAGDPGGLADASDRLGLPLLTDALSGARFDRPNVVAAFDSLVRDEELRAALRPATVAVLGAMPASKALVDALSVWEPRIVAIDASEWPADPHGIVSDVVTADPTEWITAVAARADATAPSPFLERWRLAESAAQSTFDEALGAELSEPSVARLLSRSVADRAPMVVSSSMPVRDLEWFGAKTTLPATVFANRGANGIDGVVSTALGVAAGGRAVGLIGDLAFLHDAGSLADGVGEHGGSCVLVVVDNHGGGIFSFLPQRSSVDREVFERVFSTPPQVEVAAVAAGYGAEVAVVKDLDALRAAIDLGLETERVTVVVATVPDRDANVALHRSLAERAALAARAAVAR
jgi:2-succinyl-5-enolpyruvyl-6-hydroxy-3-cyclohexene-1-carboxylate synthase